MGRNNQARVASVADTDDPSVVSGTEKQSTFDFAVPTEIVDLPSKGKFYAEGHPLHNVESVEIKYMTAKQEDILASQSLIRKGLAVDRMLQSVIIDKNVDLQDMLVGDKNAITVAARITGYGSDYETVVSCPSCGTSQDYMFDLEECQYTSAEDFGDDKKPSEKGSGTFSVSLPKSQVELEFRLLTSRDENDLEKARKTREKHKLPGAALTEQFKRIIVSVNGDDTSATISRFIDSMPAMDSRFLRKVYQKTIPNIDLTQDFECSECGHQQALEVPVTLDFFWPQ